jgi:hypothetical protein
MVAYMITMENFSARDRTSGHVLHESGDDKIKVSSNSVIMFLHQNSTKTD